MDQVLVVDDESAMRAALEANFRRQGWRVTTARGTNEALERFRLAPCPLVVTDMRMPDGDGLRVMQGVRALAPETAVIFLTAFANIPEAVNAMREGACDYLVKPISFEQLRDSAVRVMGSRASRNPLVSGGDFIGHSAIARRLIDRARQVARTDADILLEAESGTGKELLARLVHRSSPRSQRPFVAVNCAGFPDTLLESELFGHLRGAFTGATASKAGKFELANTGTLLLDEIGEMPLSLQPKLLRVLQEREIDRLGDTRPLPVDVRIIATTNRPLGAMVAEGKFRADLFFRLNVIPLTVPPLRERREDIPDLIEHFVCKHLSASCSRAVRFLPELLERLQAYDWPGNVRELENFVRRALVLAPGPAVGLELLPEAGFQTGDSPGGFEPGLTLRELERSLLEKTLDATGGNRTRAAGMLGISLRTVRNKIREYGLPPRRVS
ncbi:MAG TPA: sigma-54 dependent transcriptional regulator [Terriglobia bacterium]|nr:sigma-54 dependent transcriptional regulator [Terriglobia bacterium]